MIMSDQHKIQSVTVLPITSIDIMRQWHVRHGALS